MFRSSPNRGLETWRAESKAAGARAVDLFGENAEPQLGVFAERSERPVDGLHVSRSPVVKSAGKESD